MTHLLEEAITAVRALSPSDQDTIAEMMLEEIEAERFDERIAATADRLDSLADAAEADFRAGRTTLFPPPLV